MGLFEKCSKLKRKDISDKFYGYHSTNNINDVESASRYLDNIITYLNDYTYESDNNFVMAGRKKFVYDELIEIINGIKKVEEPIYFILGSLEEFICNNNFISSGELDGKEFFELREKNDNYISKGYISLEEKEYIQKMISSIKQYLTKNNLTKEEAIKLYSDKFGGFPSFLMMGASDENIIKAIMHSLETGEEITADNKDYDY